MKGELADVDEEIGLPSLLESSVNVPYMKCLKAVGLVHLPAQKGSVGIEYFSVK